MRYLFIITILLFTSCSKQRAALYHFNQVNDIIKRIDKLQTDYYQKIDDALANKRMAGKIPEAEVVRLQLMTKLQSYIRKIRNVHSLDNNSLRDAAATCFENILEVTGKEMKQFILLKNLDDTSQQMTDSINTVLGIMSNKKADYIAEYKKIREAFTKKYEIVITNTHQTDSP